MKGRGLLSVCLLLLASMPAHALPTFEGVKRSWVKSDSLLLDRRGEIIHELRTDASRRRLDWISLGDISPALRRAVIAAEDRRFHEHRGVDYRSLAGAALRGLTSEGFRGASTITMQIASLLDRRLRPHKGRRSLGQKWRQILAARDLEKTWGKEQILEAYLNLLTYRGEHQGIATAARALFGKHPHGLDESESLVLAALIRAPNATAAEVGRRGIQLGESMGWLIAEEDLHASLRQAFLGTAPLMQRADLAPHVARQLLKSAPAGSPVASTLEAETQRFAVEGLVHHLYPLQGQNVGEGAILVVENVTGEVLAYASHTTEPAHARYVDGVRAKRQAGSALKPLLYALALDLRILTPASLLDDAPLDVAVPGGIYHPRNYDSRFHGLVTVRSALASSLNIPAVKTLALVGTETLLRTLRDLGVQGLTESGDYYGPSLALGSADVTLWELVNAYRTLANRGIWRPLRLRPESGETPIERHVFSPEAAFLASDMLSDRQARSLTFGLENPLATRFWTAVKTGTSKDMRDNWCIGYSKRYTIGVWVGNYSGAPMWDVSGITGAAPLWFEMMNHLHREEQSAAVEPPPGMVRREIRPLPGSEGPIQEWFIRGTEPSSPGRRAVQRFTRIAYPPSGAVLALDPDIPGELQRVLFVAEGGSTGLHWVLDGRPLEPTRGGISWAPTPGPHLLALHDREDRVVDVVNFQVRGTTEGGASGDEPPRSADTSVDVDHLE